MICPQCGQETGDTKFCTYCGAAVSVQATPRAESSPGSAVAQEPTAPVPKKRGKIKKVLLILLTIILIVAASAYYIVTRAANADSYEIGQDSIPSIKAIVGYRDIGEVGVSAEGGVVTKTYSYKNIQAPQADLDNYISYLRNHGFVLTEDMDLNDSPGSTQLGKVSSEKGKIILMDIIWAKDSYEIKLRSGEGNLTRY